MAVDHFVGRRQDPVATECFIGRGECLKPALPGQAAGTPAGNVVRPDVFQIEHQGGQVSVSHGEAFGVHDRLGPARLQQRIANPKYRKEKGYWVQVEGIPAGSDLEKLRRGVELRDGLTRPARVVFIKPPEVWPREPPIRERREIPTRWLDLTISEGRNRQVRRMTAHIGFPTLRLIRYRVGEWYLGDLQVGEYRIIGK